LAPITIIHNGRHEGLEFTMKIKGVIRLEFLFLKTAMISKYLCQKQQTFCFMAFILAHISCFVYRVEFLGNGTGFQRRDGWVDWVGKDTGCKLRQAASGALNFNMGFMSSNDRHDHAPSSNPTAPKCGCVEPKIYGVIETGNCNVLWWILIKFRLCP